MCVPDNLTGMLRQTSRDVSHPVIIISSHHTILFPWHAGYISAGLANTKLDQQSWMCIGEMHSHKSYNASLLTHSLEHLKAYNTFLLVVEAHLESPIGNIW